MSDFAGKGKVAVLKTSPETVLQDIETLMRLDESRNDVPWWMIIENMSRLVANVDIMNIISLSSLLILDFGGRVGYKKPDPEPGRESKYHQTFASRHDSGQSLHDPGGDWDWWHGGGVPCA